VCLHEPVVSAVISACIFKHVRVTRLRYWVTTCHLPHFALRFHTQCIQHYGIDVRVARRGLSGQVLIVIGVLSQLKNHEIDAYMYSAHTSRGNDDYVVIKVIYVLRLHRNRRDRKWATIRYLITNNITNIAIIWGFELCYFIISNQIRTTVLYIQIDSAIFDLAVHCKFLYILTFWVWYSFLDTPQFHFQFIIFMATECHRGPRRISQVKQATTQAPNKQ